MKNECVKMVTRDYFVTVQKMSKMGKKEEI